MNAGLLFRIGLHLLGVWWLYTAVFNLPATLHRHQLSARLEIESSFPLVWSLASEVGIPFVFGVGCLGFARSIQRMLLGPDTSAPVASGVPVGSGVFEIGCRLIGVYLLASTAPWMLATIYEMLAVSTGNQELSRAQVTSDAIGNVVSLVAGVALARRADTIVRWCGVLTASEERNPRN